MNAFKFMKETSIPIEHHKVRTKILSLVNEIESLYKQHLRKSTGKTCDICGAGDDNEIYRVKMLSWVMSIVKIYLLAFAINTFVVGTHRMLDVDCVEQAHQIKKLICTSQHI
jgi:hypothetical protein